MKREKHELAIVKLYNLHLTCGWKFEKRKKISLKHLKKAGSMVFVLRNDGFQLLPKEETREGELRFPKFQPFQLFSNIGLVKEIRLPTAEDRKRLIEFFNVYAPNVTRWQNAQNFVKGHQKANGQLEVMVKTDGSPWGSLGWYEHDKGIEWWKSEDFFLFMWDYLYLREGIDWILKNGSIPFEFLRWYKNQIEEIRHSIILTKEGKPIEADDFDQGIPLGKVKFEVGAKSSIFRYGLNLGRLFYQIFEIELPEILNNPRKIRRCEAFHYPTPRYGKCFNIFYVSHRGKEFCSTTCRRRVWYYQKYGSPSLY